MVRDLYPVWIMPLSVFHCDTSTELLIVFNFSFVYSINYDLHTLLKPLPYGYNISPTSVCSLLQLVAVVVIWLTFSVNSLCASLLNFCCNFKIVSFFIKSFLYSENLILLFYDTLFCALRFLSIEQSSITNNIFLVSTGQTNSFYSFYNEFILH